MYYSTLTGIALLEFVFLIKELIEDRKRYKFDKAENSKQYSVYDKDSRTFRSIDSESINVGSIIELPENSMVPSDIILLQSSHRNGNVYATTSTVDGESGIKCFKSLDILDLDKNIADEIESKVMHKSCERSPPSKRLAEMSLKFDSKDISHNTVALRGFNIIHTEKVYGIVVYTGKDTSMMQNVSGIQSKISKFDERVNTITFYSILATIFLTFATAIPVHFYKLTSPYSRKFTFMQTLLGYMVLYSSLSPLSIYSFVVVFEFIMQYNVNSDKVFQKAVKVNRENSLPDFGTVDIICTDKTGTLTRNKMELKKIIVGKIKNDDKSDRYSKIYSIDSKEKTKDYFIDLKDFLITALICNSSNINPTQRNNKTLNSQEIKEYYLSTNQDDESLLIGAFKCNALILNKSEKRQEIVLHGKTMYSYDLFADNSIEFNHINKFVCVVCRCDQDGKYYAYLKGAYDKLITMVDDSTLPKDIDQKLNSFYKSCYRILCFVYASFDALPSREDIINYKRFKFVALSGTEDNLAQGVKSVIKSVRMAGIKFIMLTGDHHKTAKNIALSCGLADLNDTCVLSPKNYNELRGNSPYIDFSFLNPMEHDQYAIFDSKMTTDVLKYPKEFLNYVEKSKCLVFSRSTPDTKASLVEIFQSQTSKHIQANGFKNNVLAIGDGANDVAMLRNASLSIGIRGKEGLIASSSSDISVDQFFRLKRLVLVHGAWNYLRATLGILIFTYKNVAFFIPNMIYVFLSDFSIVKIYNDMLNIAIVFFFTSFSLLPISAIDHQIGAWKRMKYPILYHASLSRKNYTKTTIFVWLQAAIIHGSLPFIIIFLAIKYFAFPLYNGKLEDYQYLSTMTTLTTLIVIIAKIQLVLHHISLSSFILTLSALIFFAVYMFIPFVNDPFYPAYIGEVFSSLQSYILIVTILIVCLFRDIVWIWLKRTYWQHTSLIQNNLKGLNHRLEAKPFRIVKKTFKKTTKK